MASQAEGVELISEAAARGTRAIYGTPHVWPIDGLSSSREADVRVAHTQMRAEARRFGVDLQLGFEVTPTRDRHSEDPRRYRLGDLEAVLVEVPFRGPIDVPFDYARFVEAEGLVPILAHPERSDAILSDMAHLREARDRGWLIQLNGSSILGRHGRVERNLAWEILAEGLADVIASDGHRASRPPFLDATHAALRKRLGDAADKLVDGSALARARGADVCASGAGAGAVDQTT